MPAELKLPIRRVSLVDSVYETLLEGIVSAHFPPGAELNSVELAERFDVSRTPVKEAIKLLIHDGFVEQINNHKARVARCSPDDVAEIYEVRKHLEAAAAEKAARNIDRSAAEALYQKALQLEQSQGEADWAERAIEFDLEFHDAVAAASGNRYLRKEIARYRTFVRGFCRMTGREATLRQALQEHLAILDALRAGKPAAARKAMLSHIDARRDAAVKELQSQVRD